jgi:alpha-tubulin suppressor-like RCC1 family protein
MILKNAARAAALILAPILLVGCEAVTTLNQIGTKSSLTVAPTSPLPSPLASPGGSPTPVPSPSPSASPVGSPTPVPSLSPLPSPTGSPTTQAVIRPYADLRVCGLSRYGYVYCWGNGTAGALGNGLTSSSGTPVQVLAVGGGAYLSGIVDLTSGLAPCALTSAGGVVCWGNNQDGALGTTEIPNTSSSSIPVQVMGVGGTGVLSGIKAISGGSRHVCAVSNAGAVYCWGHNANGKLGNGTSSPANTPVQVVGVGGTGFLGGISKVSAGFDHTCATANSGAVYCWGWNVSGQLGDNRSLSSSTPVQVLGAGAVGFLSGSMDVSSGIYHGCSLQSGGTVYCWGGNPESTSTPAQKRGLGGTGFLTGISAILSAPWSAQCALSGAGGLYCWGDNDQGQLGNNSTSHSDNPVQVAGPGGSGVLTSVSAAGISSGNGCAVQSSGAVHCWGDNSNGQLGDGSSNDSLVPVRVKGPGGTGSLGL